MYVTLAKKILTSVFVKRFLIGDIKIVPISRLDTLGLNKVDRERASKTPSIREAWDLAIAIMRGDI